MNTQHTESKNGEENKYIGWYVVAFLDLLGQQDALRNLTALPNIEDQQAVDAFKRKVGEFYKPLYALKTFFEASIKPFLDGSIDEAKLSPNEREILTQFRSTPILYRYFSDSLIVHIPLNNDMGKFQCRAIYSVFAATAATVLSCMVHSWAIRGGIEIGLGIEIQKGEIYGPALARAYNLESRVAQYPRVVIGEELVRYLQSVAEQTVQTAEDGAHGAHAGFASKSLRLLSIDDDGHTFLDWLCADIRSTFHQHMDLIQSAYSFVVQQSNKCKETRNSKLGFRYSLLRDYIESRLPLWGFSLESE